MSAVSNNVIPRSIALWITLREVSRSVRWPKLLQPRPTADTRRPEPPRLRICMIDPVGVAREGPILWPACRWPARCAATAIGAGQECRNKKNTHKKMRPRSDAATDREPLGARDLRRGA